MHAEAARLGDTSLIEGGPSQRNRRDPVPSVTWREVMAHIEAERPREAQRAREDEMRGRRGRAVTSRATGRSSPRWRG